MAAFLTDAIPRSTWLLFQLAIDRCHSLIFAQVQHAAVKLQCVVRGHDGRLLFRARCLLVAQEMMQEGSSSTSGDSAPVEAAISSEV
jgi:hypothetical protein